MKKIIILIATFAGAHGSLGYEKGKEYHLSVKRVKGRYIVNRTENPDQEAKYDSLFGFLRNWNNIKYVSEGEDTRELTFGEKAVGLSFNPSNNTEVDAVKRACGDLIDMYSDLKAKAVAEQNGEAARMYSLAITELQSSQMWAVKAITWKLD